MLTETEKRYVILSLKCIDVAWLVEAVMSDDDCVRSESLRRRISLNGCSVSRVDHRGVGTILRAPNVAVAERANREYV